MSQPSIDMTQIWVEYKQNGERSLRNRLMEHYLQLVRYTADRIAAKLPSEVDVDDLISAGIFGLLDAIEAFDLARGVKFETYCSPRIRGAILDELRTMDWVPRLVRNTLRAELGRLPNDDEIAHRLQISRVELDKLIRDSNAVSLVSLSRKFYDEESSTELEEIDVLRDRRSEDPVGELQRRDLHRAAMDCLSRIERIIVVLYYSEQMTMKEIGQTLDLSESRVSQMHSSILKRLTHQMTTRGQLQFER